MKKETNLIICKFTHVQNSAICNKFRAKLKQLQKCPADPWPPKQQGLTHGFEKGDDVIASNLSGENVLAC